MCGGVDLHELSYGDVGVDLRRRELGVAELLLDEADVGPVSCMRVAQACRKRWQLPLLPIPAASTRLRPRRVNGSGLSGSPRSERKRVVSDWRAARSGLASRSYRDIQYAALSPSRDPERSLPQV